MAEASRRTGWRIRALAGPDRWIVIGTIAAFALVPLIAAVATLAQGWQATGDVAIIGLRSRDAYTSHAPLVGQPTTGEEFTGEPSNHPGPVEYWILGLTIRVLGDRAGIVIGAALVNGAALAGVAFLAFRRGGPALLALTSVALATLVHALGAASLHDAFNSELATYPMLLALLAAWSVAIGDLRTTPVLAAAATVAAQVHVAGAAFVAPLLLVAAGSIVVAWRRHPKAVRRDARAFAVAGGILVVGWLPVLAQELSAGPSNVAALWRTATTPRPKIGLAFILERLAAAVAPIPTFVRSTGRLGFVADTSAIGVVVAAILLAAVAAAGLLVRERAGRRDVARLGALALFATATSVYAGSGQPPLSAFRADGTRWLWIISLVVWVLLAWAGWHLLRDEQRDRARQVVLIGGSALAAVLLVVAVAGSGLTHQRDGKLMAATDRAADSTTRGLPKGTYHLQYEGNQALVTVGPGIAYRLEASGYHVEVDDNSFDRGYGPQRTDDGAVVGRIRISSTGSTDAGPGEELVATERTGQGNSASTIRVFVAR